MEREGERKQEWIEKVALSTGMSKGPWIIRCVKHSQLKPLLFFFFLVLHSGGRGVGGEQSMGSANMCAY